jgi:methylglyoxal synthase
MVAETRKISKIKNIALVAHDNMKEALLEWVKYNLLTLEQHNLYATGTTGLILENDLGLQINKLRSGPLGGDQQIGAMIADGALQVVIAFFDPMEAHPHDTDIKALVRIASVYNIPIACNRSTADFLISSPLFTQTYEIQLMDYSNYTSRFDKKDE